MKTTNHFLITLLVCLSFCSVVKAQVSIKVGSTPKQTMRYGMDYERLWYWTNSLSADEKDLVSKWSVVDNDIDFIRVAINSGYELTEGDYNLSAYTNKIIPMMKDMQDANPDIKFFASPRPLDEATNNVAWQPYPQWITGSTGSNRSFSFNWEKCAEYLVRYIELMDSYGFEINYLDLTNEWNFVTPTHVRDIAEYLEDDLGGKGLTMPKIIAPSTWSYAQGASWLNNVNTTRRRDAIDIVASHNTDPGGSAGAFVERSHDILGSEKEIWNTELHDWKSTKGFDEVLSFSYMMEAINAGFSGLTGWLAIGTKNQGHSYILNPSGTPSRNVKYFIFNKLTNTSHRGQALDTETPNELSHTTALMKDNLLTVWAVNPNDASVNISIDLTEYTSTNKPVTMTYWNTDSDLEGVVSNYATTNSSSINGVVPAGSLSCFEITLDTEPTPPTTTDGNLVHITKRNATGFAIDGGTGGSNGQNVTLSVSNTADEGQLWVEIDRGDGFYSYEKYGTNYSLDGNGGGATRQSVYVWQTDATNQNQQWQKVAVGDGGYKLIKRNATGFAINGGSGGVEGRDINLWDSASANQNLQWYITPINAAEDLRLEAEDYDNMSGIQTEASSESGDNVGFINNGDWIRFDDVTLSGITNMDARVATRTGGGIVEVRTGSVTGTLIGSIEVSNTGGYQNWTTLNTGISNASGTQDVYLVFTGGNGYLFNVNWVEFNTSSRSNKDIIETVTASEVVIYPNPVSSTTTIQNAENSILNIYDMNGSIVFTQAISSESETIDLSKLTTGIYYAKVKSQSFISILRLLKK